MCFLLKEEFVDSSFGINVFTCSSDNSFSIELKNDTLDCIYNIVKIDSIVIHATITTCNSLHVSTEKLAESLSIDFS